VRSETWGHLNCFRFVLAYVFPFCSPCQTAASARWQAADFSVKLKFDNQEGPTVRKINELRSLPVIAGGYLAAPAIGVTLNWLVLFAICSILSIVMPSALNDFLKLSAGFFFFCGIFSIITELLLITPLLICVKTLRGRWVNGWMSLLLGFLGGALADLGMQASADRTTDLKTNAPMIAILGTTAAVSARVLWQIAVRKSVPLSEVDATFG
jgi:hypothetical protein